MILMKNIYFLHIINKTINMIGILKDHMYTCEHRKIITSIE